MVSEYIDQDNVVMIVKTQQQNYTFEQLSFISKTKILYVS